LKTLDLVEKLPGDPVPFRPQRLAGAHRADPSLGPAPDRILDAVGSQQGRDPQLGVSPRFGQLLSVPDHVPQLAEFRRREPDVRQVAHAQQICQQPGIRPIGLVGTRLDFVDVGGMCQGDLPASGQQFIRQSGRPTTRLDRGHDAGPVRLHRFHNPHCRIVATPVQENGSLRVHHAHLYERLVIVQSDKHRYTRHLCRSRRFVMFDTPTQSLTSRRFSSPSTGLLKVA
jgi:hypothetical protein